MRVASLAVLACLLSIAPAWGQQSSGDWKVERFEHTLPLSEGASVRVENPRGNLWVRTHHEPGVYLLVHVQRHPDDPREVDLSLSQTEEELGIDIAFAQVEVDVEPDAWTKRRVDVTVFVPPTTPTHFSTATGLLEVLGTHGPTEVETASGDIRLRIHGTATAQSEHGSVLAQFMRTDWSRPVEITTSTGAIRVEMPDGGRAEVVAETRGEISSDFSTEIEWLEAALLKRATLSVGEHGVPMKLMSHQGSIKVLQSLVPTEDKSATNDGD